MRQGHRLVLALRTVRIVDQMNQEGR